MGTRSALLFQAMCPLRVVRKCASVGVYDSLCVADMKHTHDAGENPWHSWKSWGALPLWDAVPTPERFHLRHGSHCFYMWSPLYLEVAVGSPRGPAALKPAEEQENPQKVQTVPSSSGANDTAPPHPPLLPCQHH